MTEDTEPTYLRVPLHPFLDWDDDDTVGMAFKRAAASIGGIYDEFDEHGQYLDLVFWDLTADQVRELATDVLGERARKVTVTGQREVTVEVA